MLWEPATRPSAPAAGEVHLHRATVDHARAMALWPLLAPDERARAERLVFEADRRRFVFARGGLRHLLGACLGIPPAAVPLAAAERGKPHLAGHESLQFNVAHTQDQVLYALAHNRRVGVDIESLLPPRDYAEVAARFFAPHEQALLAAATEADRWRAFLTIWTRKEAWVKATGEGVWDGFKHIDTAAPPAPGDAWTRLDLQPAPHVLAALAAEGRNLTVRGFDFVVRS